MLRHNTEVEFGGFWRNNDKVILRPFVYHLRYLSSFFARWLHPVGRASAPPLDIGWVTNGKWFFCYLSGNWFLMSCCCLLKRHKELFLKRLKRYIERILTESFAVLTGSILTYLFQATFLYAHVHVHQYGIILQILELDTCRIILES